MKEKKKLYITLELYFFPAVRKRKCCKGNYFGKPV
jgi:hypothetical protein